MNIRKSSEMKVEFNEYIHNKRIEIIENEIRILMVEINRTRAGKSNLTLEEIEKQLDALQDFIALSK